MFGATDAGNVLQCIKGFFFILVVHVLHTVDTFPLLILVQNYSFFFNIKVLFSTKNIPNSITFRVLHSIANESLENFFLSSKRQNNFSCFFSIFEST